MKSFSCVFSSRNLACLWIFGGLLTPVGAQTNWTGGAALRGWDQPANWSPAAIPTAATDVVFNNGNSGAAASEINIDFTIGSLRFAPTADGQAISHQISIASGKTLNITGTGSLVLGTGTTVETYLNTTNTTVVFSGGGKLVVNNTAGVMDVGVRSRGDATESKANLDLRGLGMFEADVNQLRIGYSQRNAAILYLSNTENKITANLVSVGNSVGLNASSQGELVLGAGTNVFNVDTLDVGRGKAGQFAGPGAQFRFGGATGSVEIGSKTAGVGTNINVGVNTEAGTSANMNGLMDLNGHNATITANAVTIGRRNQGGATSATSGSATGTLNFNQGTFTANSLLLGSREGTAADTNTVGDVTGILNIGGGTFTINQGGSVILGKNIGGNTRYAQGELNLTGGTFNSFAHILDGGGTATGVATSILRLNGGTLDMKGYNIGDAVNPIDQLLITAGTLRNVGQINGGTTGLIQTGAGTLVLDGYNGYTGGTSISGTVRIGSGGVAGNLGDGAINLAGTLAFNRSNTYRLSDTQVMSGTSGRIFQEGPGRTIIGQSNTGLTATRVEVNDGILLVTDVNGLGEYPEIVVGASGEFHFVVNSTTEQVMSQAYELTVASGGTLGVGLGSRIDTSSAAMGANVTLKIFGNPEMVTSGSPYTLVSSEEGGLDAANYNLKFYGLTDAIFEGFVPSANALVVDFIPIADLLGGEPMPDTVYWKGGYSNNEWAASNGRLDGGQSNWSFTQDGSVILGIVPGRDTTVNFSAANASAANMENTSLGYDMAVKQILVGTSSPVVVTDDAYQLTVVGGNANQGATGDASIFVSPTSSLTLNVDLHLEADNPLIRVGLADGTGANTAVMIVNGELSGNGFEKQGSGTLTLSGSTHNTYSGTTQVSQGVLLLNKTVGLNAISGSNLIIGEAGDATSNLRGTVRLLASDQIKDDVRVTMYAGNTFDLNGKNETIGALDGPGGSITNSLAASTSTLTIGFGGGSGNFAGIIANGSGTTALTKVGSGVQTLSGVNTYSGLTTVLEGTLRHGITNALAGGAVTVNGASAVWDLNGFTDSVGTVTVDGGGKIIGAEGSILTGASYNLRAGEVSVVLAGSGAVTKSTDGLVILSGNNTFTGATTINGGILRLTSSGALGTSAGATTVSGGNDTSTAPNGTLELSGDIVINDALTIGARGGSAAGIAALRNYSGNNVWTGNITGITGGADYFIESQSGTLFLTGTLQAGSGATGNGRNFRFFGDGDIQVSGTIQNGTADGGLNVYKAGLGTLVISGANNTYSGTTSVTGGVLKATTTAALGNTSRLTVGGGGTFIFQTGIAGNELVVNALTLSGTNRIGVELGNNIRSVAAATTTNATVRVDVIGISGANYTTGEYDLIKAASGLNGSGSSYILGNLYNITNFIVDGPVNSSANRVWINIIGTGELTTAYWKGGFSETEGHVWAVTNGTTKSNWVDELGNDTPLVPGASTNVIFSAVGATNQATPMTLGANMGVGTLTFNDAGAVHLEDFANNLTLHGQDAITVNGGAGVVTLNTNLIFANVDAMIDVATGQTLKVGAIRGANGFTKEGAGTIEFIGSVTSNNVADVTIREGTALLNRSTGIAAVGGRLVIGEGAGGSPAALVRLMNDEQIANNSDVLINNGGTLDLNGFTETLDGLYGTGVVTSTGGAATLIVGAGNDASANFGGSIQNGGGSNVVSLRKVGTGTQTLSGQNTYTGGTYVYAGTLALGADNALATSGAVIFGNGTTAGTLDLNGHDQTIGSMTVATRVGHQLIIDAGNKLTQTGSFNFNAAGAVAGFTATGGGSWVIQAPTADFVVTHTSGSFDVTTDLSGLGNFRATVTNFNIGTGSGGNPITHTKLAKSNTITAASIRIGASSGTGTIVGTTFELGRSNVFNANNIMLATSRTSATMSFQVGTGNQLIIRGQAGGDSRANLVLGANANTNVYAAVNDGSSSPNGVADLRGGEVDFRLNDFVLGLSQLADPTNGVGYGLGTFSYAAGTIDANNLIIGRVMNITTNPTSNPGTNQDALHAQFNMEGGTLLAGNISIAQNEDLSTGVNAKSRGAMTISGGEVVVTNNITMGSHVNATPSTGHADATLNLTGGMITVGGNISEGADGNNVSLLKLDGATLDMTDGVINVDTFQAISGTLKNLAQLNASNAAAALTKTGAGKTLYLAGTNAYTGATSVDGGRLFARSGTAMSGTNNVTVKSGTEFHYSSGVLGQDLVVGGSGSTLTLQNNSRVGVELGNQIKFGGAATTTGAAITIDVYGISGADYNLGTYDVITAASGLNNGNYSLGLYYNRTNFTVTGIDSTSPTYVRLNVTRDDSAALTTAYWKGAFASGPNNVWAVSNATNSNWTTDLQGTQNTGYVPGTNARVIFAADNAANYGDMKLGADMGVGSVEFETGASTNFKLNDTNHNLTLNQAGAVVVRGDGEVELNTNLRFANANATVEVVNAGGDLVLGGTQTGTALNKTGAGRVTMGGVGTYTGAVGVNAGSLNVIGKLNAASLTVSSGATLQGRGSVVSSGPVSITGALSVGDGRVTAPVASRLEISSSGTLTFASTSTVSFDLISGGGSGALNEGGADLLKLTGVLNIQSGATLELGNPLGMANWAIGDAWRLFDWTGISNLDTRGQDFVIGDSFESVLAGTGLTWDLSDLYVGGTIMAVAVIPEPTRAVLLLCGAAALLLRRRRTRNE